MNESRIMAADRPPPASLIGMNRLVRTIFDQTDVAPVWSVLIERATVNPADASALMDIAILLQSRGKMQDGLEIQRNAIDLQRDFQIVHGDGSGVRILAFLTAGDFMANTPLDFLLNGSNAVLYLCYVDAETESLDGLPEHDVAFVAVGESEANAPVLQRLARLLSSWTGPIMNNQPERIRALTRDGVCARLEAAQAILAPKTWRTDAKTLAPAANGAEPLSACIAGLAFPIIIRPVGTHAGHGMERIEDAAALAAYLPSTGDDALYVAPFIDYRSADGRFHKQRIVLIDGKPYASHLAISDHWMVHYLNAGMAESAEKRALEAKWMQDFETDFAVRHAKAFAALYDLIGLDYFGIDCAEAPDGRLLVFELDVAMIVHDMDSAELYPYKKPAMRKLFDGFLAAVERRRHAALPLMHPQSLAV